MSSGGTLLGATGVAATCEFTAGADGKALACGVDEIGDPLVAPADKAASFRGRPLPRFTEFSLCIFEIIPSIGTLFCCGVHDGSCADFFSKGVDGCVDV